MVRSRSGKRLPGPVLCCSGDELCIVAGMTFQRIRLLIAAAQLLLCKLADGLVHAVALALGISPKDHQRVVDQFGEDLGAWLPWCADCLGGFQGPPSGKDR